MTKAEAVKKGWKVTGSGSDWAAEKGRFIFMGPSEAFVLKMAAKTEEK